MKFLIVSLAVLAVACALPADDRKPIAILQQNNEQNVDSYQFSFEAENGISASESGSLKAVGPEGESAVVVQGQFQYTDDQGNPIALTYTADETGYHPQGAHLPVAPAIPEAIQRSLEYNAAHPEQEEEAPAGRKPSRF